MESASTECQGARGQAYVEQIRQEVKIKAEDSHGDIDDFPLTRGLT